MMQAQRKQVIVIGGGPAGLAAAIAMHKNGVTDILVIERESSLGGILRQCIHDGFGLTRFREALSGPEYAQRFIDEAQALGIQCLTNTTVLSVSPDKQVVAVNRQGMSVWSAGAVVLAMGCRERTRGALAIPGERPGGVMTAGVAQAYINLYNKMVGKEVIILGSGDIGLIMARRLTLEGARVKGVFEVLPHPSGLSRNIQQCLEDYEIPLYLSHTVTEIHGSSRITGVTISQVDEALRPIPGTETRHSCDTLILSVGLIPENELSIDAGVQLDPHTRGPLVDQNYQTSVPGVFAAGNVLHVHDLVDFVSLEAERLAGAVAAYVSGSSLPDGEIPVQVGDGVGHTIPQRAAAGEKLTLSLRVKQPVKNCAVQLCQGQKTIHSVPMKKALPAEMIQLELPADLLDVKGGPLEVKIVC